MNLRRDSGLWDALAAVAFAVAGILDAALNSKATGPLGGDIAAALAMAAVVLVRRRHPLESGIAACAILLVEAFWLSSPADLALPIFALLLFPYASGAHERGVRGWLIVPIALATVVIVDAAIGKLTFPDVVFPGVMGLASWIAGRTARRRMELAVELHEAAVRAEEERDAEARRAVSAERRRIAREMHDIVAHSISVMVVQAGGARRIMDTDPERAAAAGAEIEHTGRAALLEMRRLLGAFRDAAAGAQRAPAPSVEELGALVERARSAGLPVQLTVEGEPRALPPGIGVAAYRVVQEALTNALEHATGSATDVRVRWNDDSLELVVADRGPGPVPGRAREGRGHGLIGMRERVSLYGGELRTGRRRGGGFEVHARLPLEPPATQAAEPDPVPAQGAA